MRVLALTAAPKVGPRRVHRIVAQLDLGPSLELELLTIRPPSKGLPAARVDSVEPSVVPFRPIVPVSGAGLQRWTGAPRLVARVLRAGRKVLRRLPIPARLRVEDKRYLEIACATSPDLKRRAAEVDVIVALEAEAGRAAWNLAKRVDGPVVVWRASKVRQVLESRERPVPAGGAEESWDAAFSEAESFDPAEITVADEPQRVLIASGNYAGQGSGWAEAIREHVDGSTAVSMRAGVQANRFPVDLFVTGEIFRGDLEWRLAWREAVMERFTHVLVEANRAVLGGIQGGGDQHVRELLRAGKQVAYVTHGSDARIPSLHAAREPWHSYDALPEGQLYQLELDARRNVEIYNAFEGVVFVSTPGLLDFVPDGVWLPVVIDVDQWATDEPPLQGGQPVVMHVPSSNQKGSHLIDPALRRMHEDGGIEYLRAQGVPHAQMPDLCRSADIMVEQFGIADYSVAACEAMAAGRVVVSRVADAVRERVLRDTGLELPIVEANPETLEQVIADLVADPEGARAIAKRGVEFVRAVHDGRRSGEVLGGWLSASDREPANR